MENSNLHIDAVLKGQCKHEMRTICQDPQLVAVLSKTFKLVIRLVLE